MLPEIYEITYCSVASKDMNAKDIDDILQEAEKYNGENNLTGCLLYHNQEFIQILEGEEAKVKAIYDKIALDRRHTAAVILAEGKKEIRAFEDWNMAYQELTNSEAQQLTKKLFVDNFVTFSKFAEKETVPVMLFWDAARELLERQA